ncbi:hypothetical protein EJ08DRAFT_282494 [Tothia fuscella]|uniref:Uncharacterized protein n=1 Tax=Tothia fuscella TaxID=1048955 RepID=A0A9P4U454_9PEZI|nr:hypothetical protein EJ08DRAFT_282494 [Tothia fuscella]
MKVNNQKSSPLTRLPGEIRNQIYSLVLSSTTPITNPSISSSVDDPDMPSLHKRIPVLGVPLIRTCKIFYNEISLHPLFAHNVFRFTTRTLAHQFLMALPKEYAALIRDVEVDLRDVSDAHAFVERGWIEYLAWETDSQARLVNEIQVNELHVDASGLKTLRLNIEGWSKSESLRRVALLRDVLKNTYDLERVVVTGTDGSALLAGARAKYLQQWGPVVFVGVMRFARLAGMISWMADCVRGGAERKVIRWSQEGRAVSIEIMTRQFFDTQTGFAQLGIESTDHTAGNCSLETYEERWQSGRWANVPMN